MTSLMEFLQTIPQFADFSQSELMAIDKAFRVDTYADGEVLIKDGDRAERLFLILNGEVEVRRRRWDKAGYALVEKKHAGDIVGLTALINNEKQDATVVTVGTVQIASLPQSAFELLFDTHAPIAVHFQYLIARQLARDLRRYNDALRSAVQSGEVKDFASFLQSD